MSYHIKIVDTSTTYIMSRRNTKKKQQYHFELPLHEGIVRSYVAPTQLEKMMGKYNKKVKLELLPPTRDACADAACGSGCGSCASEGPKFYTLRASGSHRATVKKLAQDMVERHDNIVKVLQGIQKTMIAKKDQSSAVSADV